VVDRIRKVVENECYFESITLFLGAKTGFLGGVRIQEPVEVDAPQ
jgi:hypothetical protein